MPNLKLLTKRSYHLWFTHLTTKLQGQAYNIATSLTTYGPKDNIATLLI